MRVLLAPDKFKGSLTALEVATHLAAGIRQSAPEVEVVLAPVADGGDGTLDALSSSGFAVRTATVTGTLGDQRQARFGVRGLDAVVELAEADGLRHLTGRRPQPLRASSFGVGELILAALDQSCRHIILGLGGSANTDGGAGMLQALGARLLDGRERELTPGGANLRNLARIHLGGLDARLAETTFVIAGDVDNPLLGPTGTAAVYAPQKGSTPDDVTILEAGMRRWAQVAATTTGADHAGDAGSGAAGGVAFAAVQFLNAAIEPGIKLILELLDFDQLLTGISLVVTGEGSLDEQSLNGKAPVGVAAAAARHRIPTIAVAGQSVLTADKATAAGISAVYSLAARESDISVCINEAGRLLEELGADLALDLTAHADTTTATTAEEKEQS